MRRLRLNPGRPYPRSLRLQLCVLSLVNFLGLPIYRRAQAVRARHGVPDVNRVVTATAAEYSRRLGPPHHRRWPLDGTLVPLGLLSHTVLTRNLSDTPLDIKLWWGLPASYSRAAAAFPATITALRAAAGARFAAYAFRLAATFSASWLRRSGERSTMAGRSAVRVSPAPAPAMSEMFPRPWATAQALGVSVFTRQGCDFARRAEPGKAPRVGLRTLGSNTASPPAAPCCCPSDR